ncbi:sensor histidine kinase KdpD [Deefgea tanakiae]|uniref:histidine kinase n=1 Tax=Deefgea tanakiae TaxID=2865840 RepID=A0ABX8Z1G0_9NEIS|nr:sensor histidine kinase KdpD [Deefgea tanakiae]QZA76398.1 sensor histidine kinase KdpD [Deefgea tanakiae]
MNETLRPDPDALIAQLQREEEKSQRGRLKVFFGACAGVGKTYAMLAAAHARIREGVEVVVGVVETHGRSETQAQLNGLEILPAKQIEYRGRHLGEFDLDQALLRKPALILIDEFAHSNVAGSRHTKRWQDVEELLAAGIDVYTTLNVQHLESLNDIVSQITGIIVRETVPDHMFDLADEVTLVDLPPEELLSRLAAGKVYLGEQANRAAQHFFRKGNLLALRELALRRTADRVDAQMREYRADQSIQPVWQARERLLVCVGPGSDSEKLIRSASRLAVNLHADWLAIYVETPALQRQSKLQRERILANLRLAQELGAETSVLAGADLPQTLLAYARSRNVSKLVVGKSQRGRVSRLWRIPLSEQLAQRAQDVDVYVVAHEFSQEDTPKPKVPHLLFNAADQGTPWRGYGIAMAACTLTTLLAAALLNVFDLANVVIVFLLTVVLVAMRYGRGPGVLASFLSVLSFDFFFVHPKLSLTVADTQYLFTFLLMLSVALIISQLASSLRFEAQVATYRERRTRALYELGRELAGALTAASVVEMSVLRLAELFDAQLLILLPDAHDQLQPAGEMAEFDIGLAQWVFDKNEMAGRGTHTLPASKALYLPLKAPMRLRGVMALIPADDALIASPEQQRLLETCASQIALSLERVHYVEVAQDAIVAMESERLRNSVLSTVSHDLRTPLTSLIGMISLLRSGKLIEADQQSALQTLNHEAQRMHRLVINLLDMAKLQSGVTLHREWQVLEEVIGSTVRECAPDLLAHHVRVDLPSNLPLLEYDAVLIERVLVNLLGNAAKYTPAGSEIIISAQIDDQQVTVLVSDNGPGLPAGAAARLFEKFTRGVNESATPGVGLGLAICRSIITAHGGQIQARNLSPNGAEFSFTLPRGTPPILQQETE